MRKFRRTHRRARAPESRVSLRKAIVLELALGALTGCATEWGRLGPSAQGVPGYLEPLERCAQAHGYILPPLTWAASPAASLSNGAAACCIADTEPEVVKRWGIVGCYGAVPIETDGGFKLKVADRCVGPDGRRFSANKWYAHHELTHIILRAATGDWDEGHSSSLWSECPNPFDAQPLFGSG